MSLSSELIDLFLGGCDQLMLWIDDLESQEKLDEQATSISQAMIEQFKNINHVDTVVDTEPSGTDVDTVTTVAVNWLAEQLGREQLTDIDNVEQYDDALLIVYKPDRQCFFSGDDPLAWMKSVPQVVWKKVVLTPDTEPFDIYQSQLTFYVLTQSDVEAVTAQLEPIESQYQLYRFAEETTSDNTVDKRIDYVKHIVSHQICLLETEQSSPEIRLGTIRSVIRVYRSLACQIIDRPEPVDETMPPEQIITLLQRIIQSFDDHKAVIETEQVAPTIPATTSVNDQIEKVKKNRSKPSKLTKTKSTF